MDWHFELEEVSHKYGDRIALRSLSLRQPSLPFCCVLGPNGSGKSTLFRLLSTQIRPQSGKVSLLGLDNPKQSHEIRRRIGVVFSTRSLDRKLTLSENMVHHAHLYGLSGALCRQRIAEQLEIFGLQDRAKARVAQLSDGFCRRLELARCMLHQPELLILDEPTGGLDPSARAQFWHYLQTMCRERDCAVLYTTHLFDEAERADHLVILDGGSVVASASPTMLKSEIRGGIITITARDPAVLRQRIEQDFHVDVTHLDTDLRIESTEAAPLTSRLLEAFPEEITMIRTGPASLEDVYINKTGKSFQVEM